MQILGLHVADFTLLVLYLLGIAGLGLWVSRSVRTEGDFFLGGRRFGKFFAIFHQFGTGTHADQPVAVTGKAHEIGLAGIWYQWLWLFCTPFYWLLAPIFRRLRYVTTGDFFERRYGTYLGQAYAVVGLAIFMLNIGIMLNGTGRIVESVTGGALSQLWAILLITLFFVVYAVVGGMVAAVITDAVQGMFIIVLSFILLPFVIAKAGGFTQLHQLLTPDKFSLVAPRDVTLFFIVMTVVNALVNIVTQPHTNENCGVARNERDASVGFVFGPAIKRVCTIAWAFTGVAAIALYPDLAHHEDAFGVAARDLLPVGLVGLMVASIMAANMSSCDSFLVDASALFTRNLYAPYPSLAYWLPGLPLIPLLLLGAVTSLAPGTPATGQASQRIVLLVLTATTAAAQILMVRSLLAWRRQPDSAPSEDQQHVTVGRLVSVITVCGGIGFALVIPSVAQGLKYFWIASALMGPAWWLGVVWRRANRWGAWASFLGALAAWLISWLVLGWDEPHQMALYLPVAFLAHIFVSLMTPPEPHRKLRDFYLLLRTPVGREEQLRRRGVEIVME